MACHAVRELPAPVTAKVLIEQVRSTFEQLPDVRKGGPNQRYAMPDAALSAFAVFFTQSPSFLDYQERMQKDKGRNNASALFGVHQIPSDPQIRNLLDPVDPAHLAPLFIDTVELMHRQGQLETHRALGGLLIALDGTQYFSSMVISCPACSSRALRNGQTEHSHVALTPAVVAPGQATVFPLPPAFVVPQDGHAKQDCELAAGARWLAQWAPRVAQWGATTFLGDDLYCHQPFCRQVLAQGCDFLFTCLPACHATLYEWVSDLERAGTLGRVTRTRWTGRQRLSDTYRFASALPLRGSDDALLVHWCELTSTDADGKVLYRGAWATSHAITAHNVIEVAQAARSRWKIENENNNTLKTKGYHFEHNFGHGRQHLSSLLACMMLLAYLMHTVLDLLEPRYRAVRAQLPSRVTFFEHLRALALYLPFEGWDELFDFMLEGLKPAPRRAKTRMDTG